MPNFSLINLRMSSFFERLPDLFFFFCPSIVFFVFFPRNHISTAVVLFFYSCVKCSTFISLFLVIVVSYCAVHGIHNICLGNYTPLLPFCNSNTDSKKKKSKICMEYLIWIPLGTLGWVLVNTTTNSESTSITRLSIWLSDRIALLVYILFFFQYNWNLQR